jgi:uncharacterized protein YjaG (DUF416 family)
MCQTDPKAPAPAQDSRHVRYRSHRCERIVDNYKKFCDSQFGPLRVALRSGQDSYQIDAVILTSINLCSARS